MYFSLENTSHTELYGVGSMHWTNEQNRTQNLLNTLVA